MEAYEMNRLMMSNDNMMPVPERRRYTNLAITPCRDASGECFCILFDTTVISEKDAMKLIKSTPSYMLFKDDRLIRLTEGQTRMLCRTLGLHFEESQMRFPDVPG